MPAPDLDGKVQLSSTWARMPLYGVMGFAVGGSVFVAVLAWNGNASGRGAGVAFAVGAVVLYVRWILRSVTVKVAAEAFFLSRGAEEIEVPLAQLAEIHIRKGQMTLRFEPPTAFGREFDVSAPLVSRPAKAEKVLRRLHDLLEARREKIRPYAASAVVLGIVARASIDDAGLIPGLEEADLDYLADHLPPYAPVRDVVLRERQKRWYG